MKAIKRIKKQSKSTRKKKKAFFGSFFTEECSRREADAIFKHRLSEQPNTYASD